jgi:hypothetical protein
LLTEARKAGEKNNGQRGVEITLAVANRLSPKGDARERYRRSQEHESYCLPRARFNGSKVWTLTRVSLGSFDGLGALRGPR